MKLNRTIKIRGFTLIEVLLAVTIFAIVLFAINTVFYSALHLERATTRALDERLPLNQALAILRRDLQGAVQPLTNSTILVRDFKSGASSGLGSGSNGRLEFYTTTGGLSDDTPWGDVQKVRYELIEPADRFNTKGQDLVRYITRNILATTEEYEQQWLMGNVERLEFLSYSGNDWRDTWDTTTGDTGLPQAVRVRIQLAANNSGNNNSFTREPLELLVPLTTQARTNQAAATTTGGAP